MARCPGQRGTQSLSGANVEQDAIVTRELDGGSSSSLSPSANSVGVWERTRERPLKACAFT